MPFIADPEPAAIAHTQLVHQAGVKVVDGMRLNQRVLAPGSKPVNMTTPLGLYETNTLYQVRLVLLTCHLHSAQACLAEKVKQGRSKR